MSKIWDTILKKQNHEFEPEITIINFPKLLLSEFKKCNMAVEVYSEFLDEKIWFCSNTDMAKQIKGDDPSAVCYTTDELQKLIELNPSKEFLQKIHETKKVFNPSRIIE
ncbi:MAG: hypothetical protein E2O72_04990 [Candidatus Dadabacteria bacterium]|jgi:hypothetical protein|nr:hypothetical protein [Candidatus Dadabacteria bacterium]TDI90088.1 MAG: hypothetical protein E2O72_04990 [Candidatus Dadabacteria bacterium]